MASHHELFIVMIDYGRIGREAIIDPNDTWSDALSKVREAMNDGNDVLYVLHIHDGISEDCSEEMFAAVRTELADAGEPMTATQREWVGLHCEQVLA